MFNSKTNIKKYFRIIFLLILSISAPRTWAQPNYCDVALNFISYFVQSRISSIDDIKAFSKPMHEVWGRVGYDGELTTGLVARFKNLMNFGRSRAYRGMWVTPEEVVKISKEGLSASDGKYGELIHFSSDPSEAIRYGAQGAMSDKKGVLILIAVNPKKAKLKPRDGEEMDADMVSVAKDHVPANAIKYMWIFDPNEKYSEHRAFRAVNLNAIRRVPSP